MKLYLISQDTNRDYDIYDSAIVAAKSEAEAKKIHPSGEMENWKDHFTWCENPSQVTVDYIGKAARGIKAGVILASFNAG